MQLTREHKLFHIAVFGAIAILGGMFMLLKKDYRTGYGTARATPSPPTAERADNRAAGVGADAFGSATPEETFAKLLSALKANDADLASRYFTTPKQAEWRESFTLLKSGGGLAALSSELERIAHTWKKSADEQNIIRFTYEKRSDDGTSATQTIAFEKDPGTNTWNILEL